MTDGQLVGVYRRAAVTAAPRLMRRIGLEIVSRPSLDNHKEIDKAEVYDILARMALDSGEAIGYLAKAQEIAKSKNKSPARYLLSELPHRLQRGDEQDSRRILNTLMQRHGREPGVQEALLGLLSQLGLVRVDPATGRPVILMPSAGAAPPAAGQALGAAAPSAAPAATPLWTPDALAPEPAAPASKSKLWVPGMD
jgi:hypothetical protein